LRWLAAACGGLLLLAVACCCLLLLAVACETEESKGKLLKAIRLAQSVWWAINIICRFVNFYSLCVF